MTRPTVFHALGLSFFSRDLYREVAKSWRGLSFAYLLMLLAISWIPGFVSAYFGLADFVSDEAPRIISQIPTITIRDGKVSTDAEEPCYITDPDTGKVLAIIDTTGQVTSLEGTEALILLTESRVYQKKENGFETHDLSPVESFSVDRDTIETWLGIIAGWGLVVAFPFAVLGSYVYRIVQALIYAVIGLLMNLIAGASLGYPAILSVALVAVTPAIVLSTVIGAIGVELPAGWLIYFAVAMGYLYFGISATRVPGGPGGEVTPRDVPPDVPRDAPSGVSPHDPFGHGPPPLP